MSHLHFSNSNTNLEASVLQHFFNCNQLARIAQFGLENHTEATIANNFCVCVGDLLNSIGALPGGGHDCCYF